jgi:hypothetical protein
MAERYKMDGEELASVARTREAFARRNDAFNELTAAKADSAASRVRHLDTQADAEQAAAARALENGDWNAHSVAQRNIAQLTAQRARAEDEQRYWESQPKYARDPVENLIASKSSEPETQAWLRAHPSDALALATGSDPRRAAKIHASHADAIAEGYTPGSRSYFDHVDRYLGGTAPGRGSNERQRQVRVVKGQASGEDQLTPGEYKAATETVLWGREGGAKCGTAVGVAEYLRRRNAMRKQPGWFDKID